MLVCDEVDSDRGGLACFECGATLTPIMEPGSYLRGKMWRSGKSKSKGLLAKIDVAIRPQIDRGGALGRHERLVDRETNRYFERVTIFDSGEITHLCDEPLTEHTGHGSAKGKPRQD